MLEELQSLSPEKKKQVLIVATIIIMAIIIGVWVSYFNSIVIGSVQETATELTSSATATPASAPTPAPAPAPAAAPAVSQAGGPGVWQNMENWFGSAFGSVANIFRKPSQYNIQPQGN